jgi:class 3 adenylate cyclase
VRRAVTTIPRRRVFCLDCGQIVVADVVRQLVTGKDFLFSDRGETSLKGIQAPVGTWELLW